MCVYWLKRKGLLKAARFLVASEIHDRRWHSLVRIPGEQEPAIQRCSRPSNDPATSVPKMLHWRDAAAIGNFEILPGDSGRR